jgi:hypothetical protein
MFRVGVSWGHQGRVANAATATNVPPPPPVYGLRKDHKDPPHPVRPVCGATQSPNSRLGVFLSQIINNYVDCANVKTECHASEAFNNLEQNVKLFPWMLNPCIPV